MHPAYLDSLSWEMAEVYASVVDRILINLASYFPYIKTDGNIKKAFDYQARMLAQMGQVNRETLAIIADGLAGADDALKDVLADAIMDALKSEEPKLRKAAESGILNNGLVPPEVSANQMQAFAMYYRQSADKLNLVNTQILQSTLEAYRNTVTDITVKIANTQSIMNAAAGEVITGVSSWNAAVTNAVEKMVKNGLTGFISYREDGAVVHWSPEAYVAMDVRTTMFNTARAAVDERGEQYGVSLYQVSSHNGARPGCYPWQGKVISRDGWTGEVEDIDGNTVTVHSESEIPDFGRGGSLFGVNCRHYPMNFIPGFSALRGEPQDPEENARTYAESQTQRKLERELRYAKRDAMIAEKRGLPQEEQDKLQRKVDEADDAIAAFCKETGRARHRNREYTPIEADFPE